MVEYGRSNRWYNDYDSEIEFCKKHGFDFLQVWYKDGTLQGDKIAEPKEKTILEKGFPIIIHALFEIEDYDKYREDLLRILKYLHHKEVIIHPVCHPLQSDSIFKLAECNKQLTELFYNNGITVYIENNSRLDPINYLPNELKIIFDCSPKTELLLDIAHIDSYEHLQEIIDVRFPKCLHVADKHFSVIHEHLPVGQGDLDFQKIFNNYIKGYSGKIIFEVVTDVDDEIKNSKEIIQTIVNQV